MPENATQSVSEAKPEAEPEVANQSTADRLLQQRGWRSKYRLPLVLMVVALCLYAFSIYWILSGQGAGA